MRDGDVVLLWVNWFFVYLNFNPRLNFFVHLFTIYGPLPVYLLSSFPFQAFDSPSFIFFLSYICRSLISPS